VKPDDTERLSADFIDGDKGRRARVFEVRQASDELVGEFLDGIKEAKPQIFLAHMRQKLANQEIVIRPERPDKYPPAIPQHEMPLPLPIVRSKR
jgi:hypothetical protein